MAGEGEGKTGSFFFFSKDKRFIIKTISEEKKENLMKMLPKFVEYLE